MKKQTPEQEITKYRLEILYEIEDWKCMNKNGCNDPHWPDGCNMNLVRSHIIHGKRRIEELCEKHGFSLPSEYYLPTPPEVENNYMANLKQKERVKNLRRWGDNLTTKKAKYEEEQLRFT